MNKPTFSELLSDNRMADAYEVQCWGAKPDTALVTIARTARDWMQIHIASLMCDRFGHKLMDNGSHAGPESAEDSFICVRCGHGFHHTYY